MVLREWGSCGRVAVVDGEVVGHLIWAPPVHVPAADGFATAPISADAVILTTAHVAPEHRGGGLGRMMVQGMAKDLIRRGDGIKAVEAFGDTRGRTGRCVVPADFLLAVGFSTHRAHARAPADADGPAHHALDPRGARARARDACSGAVSGKRGRRPAPAPHGGAGRATRHD